MEEFFPVLLAAAFAIAISLYTGGVAPWWVLSCVAVAASGLAATTFTGEFDENWLYLLQDLAEAAVGLVLGLAIVRWVLPRLGVTRGHRHVATRRARADHKGYGCSCGCDDLAPRAYRRGAEHAV
jgi:uncharacterized membrane protein YbhN (UPF0104 family)